MGGEKTPHESSADASSSGADARAVPLDGDEFVVVEQENLRQQADLPGKGPSPVSPADSAALGYVLNAAQRWFIFGWEGLMVASLGLVFFHFSQNKHVVLLFFRSLSPTGTSTLQTQLTTLFLLAPLPPPPVPSIRSYRLHTIKAFVSAGVSGVVELSRQYVCVIDVVFYVLCLKSANFAHPVRRRFSPSIEFFSRSLYPGWNTPDAFSFPPFFPHVF